jgi:IS6 family transposase
MGSHEKDKSMTTLPRNFGWNRLKLSTHTYEQLQQLEDDVKANHSCHEGIHLIDAAGRKKLDAISWAVYNKQKRKDDA